jgi:hypothetical protein
MSTMRSRRAGSPRQILKTRLQQALEANAHRGLIEQFEQLDFILTLVEDLESRRRRQDRDFYMDAVFWLIRAAKGRFEELAVDVPTLAACNELEGTVTAATWMSNRWRWLRDPFDTIVPAELDPVAGPRIIETGTRWAARRAGRLLTPEA